MTINDDSMMFLRAAAAAAEVPSGAAAHSQNALRLRCSGVPKVQLPLRHTVALSPVQCEGGVQWDRRVHVRESNLCGHGTNICGEGMRASEVWQNSQDSGEVGGGCDQEEGATGSRVPFLVNQSSCVSKSSEQPLPGPTKCQPAGGTQTSGGQSNITAAKGAFAFTWCRWFFSLTTAYPSGPMYA